MARCLDQSSLQDALADAAERQQVRSRISRYFGWEAKFVRFTQTGPSRVRRCLVGLPMVSGHAVEVWFAEGFAVGIPPIKPKR